MDALKRFLSRRGPISCIYSDNGTNFIGAKRQLDELYTFLESKETSTAFQNLCNSHRMTWRTIPPRAPHWGGIWESNIKSIKTHLYRCIGQQLLCYEQLLTVLVQIECLLNSRPLCLLSDQPHTILTPAHFLNTTPLQSLPASVVDDSRSLANRKKLLDNLVQGYWKRWHMDDLHTLQLKQKWNRPTGDTMSKTYFALYLEGGVERSARFVRSIKVVTHKWNYLNSTNGIISKTVTLTNKSQYLFTNKASSVLLLPFLKFLVSYTGQTIHTC